MPNQKCPPVMVPAAPSFFATAAVMKNPTTTTNKPSEKVWSLLQGDDGFFLKEEITEMYAAFCLIFLNSLFHIRNESPYTMQADSEHILE